MTSSPLAACPSCARHVRLSESCCPFCRVPLPESFRAQQAPTTPARRLNRAALHALRMGAITMTAAACGGSVTAGGGGGGDGGASDSASVDDSAIGSSSGAGSSGGGTSSGASSGGPDDGGHVVAAYGGFMAYDAGSTEPPADAGAHDAAPDHPYIAPPYGIPPGM